MLHKHFSICSIFALLFGTSVTLAADRVHFLDAKVRPASGTIEEMSAEKVTVAVQNTNREIPANEIAFIDYDGEPSKLRAARTSYRAGRFTEALDQLAAMDSSELTTSFLKQEHDFLRAMAKAKIVLGANAASVTFDDVEKDLTYFVRNHRDSFHYYDVCQSYGDLMVRMGQPEKAKNAFQALAKAPWPEHRATAAVARGWIELEAADAKENTERTEVNRAREFFVTVTEMAENTENMVDQKKTAHIGLARCLILEEKNDEALQALEKILVEKTSSASMIEARLYNALGEVYQKLGQSQHALIAYLHTDLLFADAKTEHLIALKALAQLWRDVNHPERARETTQRLSSP